VVQVLDERCLRNSGSIWSLGKDGMDRGAVDDYAAPKVVDHSVVQVLDGRGNWKSGSIGDWSMARMDRGAVDDKVPIRKRSLAYAAG
jgi:hypothetical protein